ncbi:MAG: putative baseplate assembly protein, partial [Planctomycetaceae bacterium]
MIYFCCQENRRSLVRDHPSLNGIDYLEVVHQEEPITAEQQRTLRVFFVNPPGSALEGRFSPDKFANAALVQITGGERTTRVAVDWAERVGDRLDVHVTPRGDYARYTLSLIEPNSETPLAELDPELSRVDFSFKVECESEFDCRATSPCLVAASSAPDLDYLAKDYASFRQLMFDRLALLAPGWRERNP